MRLATGVAPIDELLGGGFESGTFTLLYGEGGSGKTTLCMHLCISAIKAGGKVVYLDTEGVSHERLDQIANGCANDYARNILFFESYDLAQQCEAVEKIVRLCEAERRIRLVVLDSLTVFYRLSIGSQGEDSGRRALTDQVLRLLGMARKLDIVVAGTTQVYQDAQSGTVRPIGGHMLMHNAKAVLRTTRLPDPGVRELTVMKHRSVPDGRFIRFFLGPAGAECPGYGKAVIHP